MEQLKSMKEMLTAQVQAQMGNLQQANCEELGAAVDMIKDLAETMYYCAITEAMESKKEEGNNTYYYTERYLPPEIYYPYDEDYYPYTSKPPYSGRMYYGGNGQMNSGNGGRTNGTSTNSNTGNSNDGRYSYYTEREMPMNFRDAKEGKSPAKRKMYMEAKQMNMPKDEQMRELEDYMQELTNDLTEMINDATLEEKKILSNKISTLASKING